MSGQPTDRSNIKRVYAQRWLPGSELIEHEPRHGPSSGEGRSERATVSTPRHQRRARDHSVLAASCSPATAPTSRSRSRPWSMRRAQFRGRYRRSVPNAVRAPERGAQPSPARPSLGRKAGRASITLAGRRPAVRTRPAGTVFSVGPLRRRSLCRVTCRIQQPVLRRGVATLPGANRQGFNTVSVRSGTARHPLHRVRGQAEQLW